LIMKLIYDKGFRYENFLTFPNVLGKSLKIGEKP